MNPKIQKLRNELDKNLDKIRKLEARNAELKQQIRELEDVDIIGMVRAMANYEYFYQQFDILSADYSQIWPGRGRLPGFL